MTQDKAYKLLAKQEGVSNSKAKELIDKGLVFIGDKKVKIARADVSVTTNFKLLKEEKAKKIFEDENLIAVNKPFGSLSEDIEKELKATLLHRLDKETSGVLVLVKNEEFREKAIKEFKEKRVYKEYIAIIEGIVSEPITIDKPILTIKGKGGAKSVISKDGKEALTMIEPLEIIGKKTKLKVVIETGRTHQIRIHLKSIGYPILGDEAYGSKMRSKRLMLHSKVMKFLGYEFIASEPKDFLNFANG